MSDNLKNLINDIEKKHGKGSIYVGEDTKVGNIDIIASTGSLKLDMAIGCMGTPRGRMLELYGNPSGGKTTLALIAAVEIQKKGGVCAFIDVENTFSRDWFNNLGGDTDKLLFCQPSSGNEALSIVEMMVKSNEVDFIIVDSSTALVTAAELEAEPGDAMMSQLARMMSLSCKKINSYLNNSKTCIAWVSQVRQSIGKYGNPNESAGGGLALKFYSSIRYDVSRGDVIGSREDPEGFITKIKIVKNKCGGAPMRRIETELYIGPNQYGIDKKAEIVDLAITNGMISKSGSWFKYNYKGNDERWQGRNSVIEAVRLDEELYTELYNLISKTVLKHNSPVEGSLADTIQKLEAEQIEKETKKKRSKKEETEEEKENLSE